MGCKKFCLIFCSWLNKICSDLSMCLIRHAPRSPPLPPVIASRVYTPNPHISKPSV